MPVLRGGIPEILALADDVFEVVVDVLDVGGDHLADGHGAGAVVLAGPLEGRVGQLPQDARPLPAADFKERERVLEVLVVREEAVDVGGLVGIE